MPTAPVTTILTPRDVDILSALDRVPLTIEQLVKLSRTFAVPFGSESRVRGRLARLREAGWVRRYRYVTAHRGTPADYYRLTLAGYRMLHGPEEPPPSKRHFAELGVAAHHHSRCLADFIVHLLVAAGQAGVELTSYHAENALRLTVGEETLYPDAALQLHAPDGGRFNFCVELDAGTERVTSEKSRDSIQRKIAFYERYQDTVESRLRVLFVTTRSEARTSHVLRVAAHLVRNPQRRLVYATSLPRFLSADAPLSAPCFHDHHGLPVSLLPQIPAATVQQPHNSHPRPMEAALAQW